LPFAKGQIERLGSLQIALLSLVWNREMYGLEIQKHLAMQGLKVGSGQLYPALKKLEQSGAITSREEQRIGISRIFYQTTKEGHKLVMDYISHFLSIFNQAFIYQTRPFADLLLNNIPITNGMVVMDFSLEDNEEILVKLVPNVGLTGRYFFTSQSSEYGSLIEERIDQYGLKEYVRIIDRNKRPFSLPDQSCDLCICLFTIHEPDQQWVINEMARLLKPNGKGVILDTVAIKNHILMDMFASFIQREELGINIEKVKKEIETENCEIIQEIDHHGVHVFIFQRTQKNN
jgi:DNA-binding PadR family transcriptional regulator